MTTNATKLDILTDHDILYKVVLIGDSSVGKSNLLSRYIHGEYFKSSPTVGVDFASSVVKLDDKVFKLQLWDTAGQERFRATSAAYYRGCRAALICYDLTNKDSFDNVPKWIQELDEKADSQDIVKMIVGNKSDLEKFRTVDTKIAERFAEENDFLFIETSAITGNNVDEAFHKLIAETYHKTTLRRSSSNLQLTRTKDLPSEQSGCC